MLRFAYHLKSRNYGRDRSLITGSGGGGGRSQVLPLQKKGMEKVLAMLLKRGGGVEGFE